VLPLVLHTAATFPYGTVATSDVSEVALTRFIQLDRYPNAANTLAELGVLSAEDQEWVMGKTLASLFPGGWDSDEQL